VTALASGVRTTRSAADAARLLRFQGAEAREIYLGKLFGYGAIVRAVREASAADAKDVAVTAQLAQEIATLARKKGAARLLYHRRHCHCCQSRR
jgi:hypothetical protein